MTTPAQLAANQANAQHSTGPQTEAGKAKTRLNPTKHGLAGHVLIIPGENQAEFDELYLDLLTEYEPVGCTEELLVYKCAEQFWFSRRAAVLLGHSPTEKHFSLYLRYQGASDRMFLKALNELRKIQKERQLQEIGSVSSTPKTAPAPPAQNPQPTPSETPKTAPTCHSHPNSTPEKEPSSPKLAA